MIPTVEFKPKSKRGGKREGAGRKLGSITRATQQAKNTLSDLAKNFSELALSVLVQVATSGESESARVAAANAILDRGYGKPSQDMNIDATVRGQDAWTAILNGPAEDERDTAVH